MIKETLEFQTAVDALIHVSKLLASYEQKYKMQSEEFYNKYTMGLMDDSMDSVVWANNYIHYLEIRHELEGQLKHAA
jgi:hypothetical protein